VLQQAQKLFDRCTSRWFDHAGLLHYTTHAWDDDNAPPSRAQRGLSAAHHLTQMAPASCHAQHMRSHLYLHLGNWSQVVDANVRAVAASDRFCKRCVLNLFCLYVVGGGNSKREGGDVRMDV
jgi:hypothetical protein